MTPDELRAEDEAIRREQQEVLRDLPPEQRFAEACKRFLQFTTIDGQLVANPHFLPTPTECNRLIRKCEERLAHLRALELARASAPVIHTHNTYIRRWFW